MTENLDSEGWTWERPCASTTCVEVGRKGDRVRVRNSSDPDGSFVLFTNQEWTAFLEAMCSAGPPASPTPETSPYA